MWWQLVNRTLAQPGKAQWRSRRNTSRRWVGGREALGPALVHGVAQLVVEGDDHAGVTDQAPGHLGADQPAALEFAGELDSGSLSTSKGTWATTSGTREDPAPPSVSAETKASARRWSRASRRLSPSS